MASTTAECPWCHSEFTGYGKTHGKAEEDARSQASNHAMNCPANPVNQE